MYFDPSQPNKFSIAIANIAPNDLELLHHFITVDNMTKAG